MIIKHLKSIIYGLLIALPFCMSSPAFSVDGNPVLVPVAVVDLNVSSDVETMLGSANDTALRTEIGCGTAATRDADQDLESTDNVIFNKLTVTEELSIGASENPLIRFRDSDCPGTDKFTGSINIPHARGTDGNETAWIYLRCMEDGSNTTQMTYDGNVSAWKIPTGKHLFFGTTQWDTGSDKIDADAIDTIVESIVWNAAGMSADGTQCADPTEVTINSGPKMYTAIPADNDGSTLYGHVIMPDSWNAGTVTFELEYLQTAADTGPMHSDICAMCRGAGETANNTWGSEIAIDDAAVTGSNAVDHTTSGVVTPNGTCAAGDTLWFKWQLDATGTTTACTTLHILGVKMEYTSNVGD